MDVTHWQELFDYNFWANRRVWACVIAVDQALFDKPLPGDRPSLMAQCIHILSVESWWIHFLQTGVVEFVDDEQFHTQEEVRAVWDQVEANVGTYLAQLTPDELTRTVRPTFWQDPWSVQAWQGMMQVLNHSTDHRAQLLDSIREFGGPTEEQDYLSYLHERARAAHERGIPPV
jgi:uncharacterized damage-inducible protein DinB